jgi:hypothetical protein
MAKLSEKMPSQHIKALVYGRSKVGKTFGAGTFPRPVFMDCDSGIATLTSTDFVKRHGFRGDIEYEQFTERGLNSRGVPQTANAFDDVCRFFDKMMKPDRRDTFDTWVVDTGTSLSAFAMNKAIVLLGGSFKGVSSSTLNDALTHGLVFPKIQDYGSERSLVEQFIGMLYSTDKNFLFLCHEKEITDKEGNPVLTTPLLTGKGVEAISALFDEVWNVRAKKVGPETVRYLQTKADGVRMAGSRTGIPDGTRWEYDAVKAALDEARKEALESTTTNKEK